MRYYVSPLLPYVTSSRPRPVLFLFALYFLYLTLCLPSAHPLTLLVSRRPFSSACFVLAVRLARAS